MINNEKNEVRKNIIKEFCNRAYALYSESEAELNRLDSEYPSADGRTLFGMISTLWEIEGYFILNLSSFIYKDELARVLDLEKSTEKLRSIWFFDYPPAVEWYLQDNGYEKIKECIEILYCLRLLCLEYLDDLAN